MKKNVGELEFDVYGDNIEYTNFLSQQFRLSSSIGKQIYCHEFLGKPQTKIN